MTPEQFTTALDALGWKQSDFCRKTGLSKNTPTNWVQKGVAIPLWVGHYLEAMQAIKALHDSVVVVRKGQADDTAEDSLAEPQDDSQANENQDTPNPRLAHHITGG